MLYAMLSTGAGAGCMQVTFVSAVVVVVAITD